jgi:hypothetical protein
MERASKEKKFDAEIVLEVPKEAKEKKEKRGMCGKKKKKKIPMVPFGVLLRYDEKSQWLVALGMKSDHRSYCILVLMIIIRRYDIRSLKWSFIPVILARFRHFV